jgi:hypothetical protein
MGRWWDYKLVKEITGQTFGRLTAKGLTGKKTRSGALLWQFTCDCGKATEATAGSVKSGNTLSCGCLRVDDIVKRFTKHGHASEGNYSPTYNSWYAMTQRCRNPKTKNYKNYGGSGITVCKRWDEFTNFLADMGERPERTTLGRFGDIGNYTPSNCAWQTHEEQVQTKRAKRRTK